MPPPAAIVAPAPAPTLASLRGRHRVLIAFAPRADDPRLVEQARTDLALTHEADDRDLRAAVVAGDHVAGLADKAFALRSRLRVPAEDFRVVLIGKDGTAAVSSASLVPATELAARIDAMPMRREEVRRAERDR